MRKRTGGNAVASSVGEGDICTQGLAGGKTMISFSKASTPAALVIVATACVNVWSAPVQWRGNGHYYEAVSAPLGITWSDAQLAAEAIGGHLATIDSAVENAFVFSLIDDPLFWNSYSGPWLGGLQPDGSPEPSENWQWVTGEPFGYTNWSSGQPNNAGEVNDEDSLHFWTISSVRSPQWNDIAGGSISYRPVGYVVEFVPEPSSFLVAAIGLCGMLACGQRRWAWTASASVRGPSPCATRL